MTQSKNDQEYKDFMKAEAAKSEDILTAIQLLQTARVNETEAKRLKERAKEIIEPIMKEYGITSIPDDENGFDINYTGPSHTVSYNKETMKAALLEKGVSPKIVIYAMDVSKKVSTRKSSISYRKRAETDSKHKGK